MTRILIVVDVALLTPTRSLYSDILLLYSHECITGAIRKRSDIREASEILYISLPASIRYRKLFLRFPNISAGRFFEELKNNQKHSKNVFDLF